MAVRDFISKRTRTEFRDTLSGWGTLRTIDTAFDNEDFTPDLYFEPDCGGYKFENGRLILKNPHARLQDLALIAQTFDASGIVAQIERIEAALETDPALAIGTAKELVESCCKTILAERNVPPGKADDLPKLIKKTMKELKLLPDDISDKARGVETIRRTLSNLGAIVSGLAEIRNLYGTGHGKHGKHRGLSARHAKLAAGAAGTLAVFLFETHQDRP